MRAGFAPTVLAALLTVACGHPQPPPPELPPHQDDCRMLVREPVNVAPVPRGFALPYPIERIYGTFGDCRPGGRQHRGLDIGGVGEHRGLGTPIRSMVRAQVLSIHRPEDDPARFGRRDTRPGDTVRTGDALPRSLDVPGYGKVFFFTRDHGSWRTGEMIVTRAIGTELDGHRIRYMHLGAVHPELQPGDVVEAGQEIGLMGGTAVMESSPHVHIDIEDAEGRRVDVAPFVGLEPDRSTCR